MGKPTVKSGIPTGELLHMAEGTVGERQEVDINRIVVVDLAEYSLDKEEIVYFCRCGAKEYKTHQNQNHIRGSGGSWVLYYSCLGCGQMFVDLALYVKNQRAQQAEIDAINEQIASLKEGIREIARDCAPFHASGN